MEINGKSTLDIVLAGVGGQGTLVAGRLLGAVAQAIEKDVKISEVHGMSQRGGSVVTYARMGEAVFSPTVEAGRADFLLAFEELEGLRWASLLRRGGVALLNNQHILPLPVSLKQACYPQQIAETMEQACNGMSRVIRVDAREMALQAGSIRAVNVVMLGAMAGLLSIPVAVWEQAIDTIFPQRVRAINHRAFRAGYSMTGGSLL